jgi:zinc protease
VSHTISVFGRVREVSDIQEPAGQEGVAALTAQLFRFGTASHDRLEFEKAVDDIAARVNAGPDFSLRVLTPQFAAGMRLLAENELRPAFPVPAFQVARSRLAQNVAGSLDTPDYLFRRAVEQAIAPPGDPTLRQATPETIMALKPADVTAYYAATYIPNRTTIVVIGDVTPAQARAVVEDNFGGWRAPPAAQSVELPPIPPNKPSDIRVPDSASLQDSVWLAENMGLPVASPERYTMILGNIILGSGFSSRLYRDLRGRSGYVYTVNSSLDWGPTRADYSISFGADPENVEKARGLVVRDLRQMQTEPVSDAELTRAKAELLRRLPMQRASVGAIAGVYLRLADLGLPIDSPQKAAERYLAITAPQIQQAFATWLRVDDLAQIVKGPPLAR